MILDTIAEATVKRIAAAKQRIPLAELRENALSMPKGDFPFEKAMSKPDISIICEVKKASPSKGIIAEDFPYLNIALDYESAGAAAISVLTEPEFFKGCDDYLKEISQHTRVPLLRKDFVLDEYQLYEAKTLGAHAALLICALLDRQTIYRYIEVCENLGLSALVEAHTADEVKTALEAGARLIGVNNRNLKTFEVNLTTCTELRTLVPEDILFVAESGIKTADDIEMLRKAKVDAVLIGETLMRCSDKKAALAKLMGGSHDKN